MYRIIRPLLFCMSADRAHALTLSVLSKLPLWLCRWMQRRHTASPVTVCGLTFANPVGLAAGFDKNADAIDALLAMGFGFIEVGAVTPKPQPGNPRPHVRRFKASQNIVNACGFNNDGIDALVERLKARQLPGIVGVNLGRNKSTPNEAALDDYRLCMQRVYPYCDFVTINISSPNTAGLRDLHQPQHLLALLRPMVEERDRLQSDCGKALPIFLKLSPDLDDEAIQHAVSCCSTAGIDAIIATNTSLQHDRVTEIAARKLPGGLSGPAIALLSRRVLEVINTSNQAGLPVVSVGGIDSVDEAQWRLAHGASLVQLYTSLVYQGPGLVRRIVRALKKSH